MFEALFILTTVDAGTRAARYILQEIGALAGVPLAAATSWAAVVVSSAAVCAAWGYLLFMGEIRTIWPMFGVANQLLATLALAIGTTFILRRAERPAHALVTFVPMLFMLATTLAAGWLSITDNYLPRGGFQGWLNATLCLLMMLLVVAIAAECARRWRQLLGRPLPAPRPSGPLPRG
jgi:carbon starvation protein